MADPRDGVGGPAPHLFIGRTPSYLRVWAHHLCKDLILLLEICKILILDFRSLVDIKPYKNNDVTLEKK